MARLWPTLVTIPSPSYLSCGKGLVREEGQGLCPPCALLMEATSSWSILPGPPCPERSRASVFNSSQHFTTLTMGQLLLIYILLHQAAVEPYKICLLPHCITKQEEILLDKWVGSASSWPSFVPWGRVTVTFSLSYSITFTERKIQLFALLTIILWTCMLWYAFCQYSLFVFGTCLKMLNTLDTVFFVKSAQ